MKPIQASAVGFLLIGAVFLLGSANVGAGQWTIPVSTVAVLSELPGAALEAASAGQTPGVATTSCGNRNDTNDAGQSTDSVGPDIIVADLQSVRYYGCVGDIHAYSVGTHACNLGDEPADWFSHTTQHPAIAQDLYRLRGDRFEQIGMSWLPHEFCWASSGTFCGPCDAAPNDFDHLGVGCSTLTSASLNGHQINMSRRSIFDPHSGSFPYPWWDDSEPETVIDRRLQVHEADLDPDLNAEARYFVQGHYVAADDAAAGNGENNASYREVIVDEWAEHEYHLEPIGQTQREQPAIRAWQDVDPAVIELEVRVPDEGLFIVALKTTDLLDGFWRYSYAVQNLNSDRSCGFFRVPLPRGVILDNIGFHDVDYHSGEVYDLTDWTPVIEERAITWSAESYAVNMNANALRFSTVYSFHFEANVEPGPAMITLGLFKPGFPEEVTATGIGPTAGIVDCNGNGILDPCDVDCAAEDCVWPCGGSLDCNANRVPDECEPDCNENGVADECDIQCCDGSLWCLDCNDNGYPDGCEPDCDGNGIPDDCVPPPDSDGDGVNDCEDLCPDTTPAGACACPPYGECCWLDGTYCLSDYPPLLCLRHGGVPDCPSAICRQGCLLGDFDIDGDVDLYDYRELQIGFSGQDGDPAYEYQFVFDYDDDQDIDLADFEFFQLLLSGTWP